MQYCPIERRGTTVNRHLRDRQFLGFTRGLQPDHQHRALVYAIDAVADATECGDMQDGVCHLDRKNECRCRDAAERVRDITLKAEREAKFQP
jgi:hypothetical protein